MPGKVVLKSVPKKVVLMKVPQSMLLKSVPEIGSQNMLPNMLS